MLKIFLFSEQYYIWLPDWETMSQQKNSLNLVLLLSFRIYMDSKIRTKFMNINFLIKLVCRTPLADAIKFKNFEIVHLLVEYNANIFIQ